MRNRFWRIAALVLGVAVVAGGAGTAYAAMSGSGPSYRLATATAANVSATLPEVGTLDPVNQADVAFAAAGTVKSVDVVPGQHVSAGHKLGSLDTSALEASLSSAKESLANANLQVSNDLASEDNAAGGSGAGGSSGAGSSSPGSPSPSSALVSALRPLQQAVLAGQRRVDGALTEAKAALTQAKTACAAQSGPGPGPSPTPTPTTTQGPTPTPAPMPTPADPGAAPGGAAAGSPGPGPSPSVTCAAATSQVLDHETAALRAEQTLSRRLTALDQALVKAIAGATTGGSGGGKNTGGGGGTGAGAADASRSVGTGAAGQIGGSGGTGGTGGNGGGPVSAAQLAADQASDDAAAAQVTVAEANLADATVVSPIAGTVLSVSASVGEMETGDTAFVVAGLHSYQVTADVPVTSMPQLRVGEHASVRPDGSSSALSGTVASIGLIPDSSSSSPATYPVTIGLTGQPTGLHPDGLATVTITTAHSSGVSVPTSAVHGSGKKATVTVYSGGKTRAVKVKVGTMGPVMTRITSGLTPGEKVVLANLDQPLPNNNPSTGPGPGGPGLVQLAPGARFFGR